MTADIIPFDQAYELATIAARPPAVFLPNAKAAERFFDFFNSNIRNRNMRRAYYRAACRFSEWCEGRGVRNLAGVKPVHAISNGWGLRSPTGWSLPSLP